MRLDEITVEMLTNRHHEVIAALRNDHPSYGSRRSARSAADSCLDRSH
jgi:hypothetical protein